MRKKGESGPDRTLRTILTIHPSSSSLTLLLLLVLLLSPPASATSPTTPPPVAEAAATAKKIPIILTSPTHVLLLELNLLNLSLDRLWHLTEPIKHLPVDVGDRRTGWVLARIVPHLNSEAERRRVKALG